MQRISLKDPIEVNSIDILNLVLDMQNGILLVDIAFGKADSGTVKPIFRQRLEFKALDFLLQPIEVSSDNPKTIGEILKDWVEKEIIKLISSFRS